MRTEIRCKVELREDDTLASPGRLTGTLLTYGERASDRPELFERGKHRPGRNHGERRHRHQQAAHASFQSYAATSWSSTRRSRTRKRAGMPLSRFGLA